MSDASIIHHWSNPDVEGDIELRQLGHLLRMLADTGRQIASIQKFNAPAICELALEAEALAEKFDAVAQRPAPLKIGKLSTN